MTKLRRKLLFQIFGKKKMKLIERVFENLYFLNAEKNKFTYDSDINEDVKDILELIQGYKFEDVV